MKMFSLTILIFASGLMACRNSGLPPVASSGNQVPANCSGTATLLWDPVTNYTNGDPVVIDGYKLYQGTQSGGPYPVMTDVGNVTTYKLSQLCSGTYYFVVTAYKANQESPYSNQASTQIGILRELKVTIP